MVSIGNFWKPGRPGDPLPTIFSMPAPALQLQPEFHAASRTRIPRTSRMMRMGCLSPSGHEPALIRVIALNAAVHLQNRFCTDSHQISCRSGIICIMEFGHERSGKHHHKTITLSAAASGRICQFHVRQIRDVGDALPCPGQGRPETGSAGHSLLRFARGSGNDIRLRAR